jgi:hypothetical protein
VEEMPLTQVRLAYLRLDLIRFKYTF